MKARVILVAFAVLAFDQSVSAADLPADKTPPIPAPAFTWAGFYGGVQIGYAFGRDSAGFTDNSTSLPVTNIWRSSYSTQPGGIIGGAHVGYDWQFDAFVLGVEGDVDASNLRTSTQLPAYDFSAKSVSAIQGAVLGRVGYSFGRVLVYATGGPDYGSIRNSYNVSGYQFSLGAARPGWTYGGGLEYAVTDNWILRAEYRYADFGKYYDAPPLLTPNIIPYVANHHWTENQIKFGLSYKL